MKVLLYGKNSQNLENLLSNLRIQIVTANPDVIISYGGDGTLLAAERRHPNIPKVPIRNSQVCKKCLKHEDRVILEKLLKGKLHLKEYQKLKTTILYKEFYALNDFVVRNATPIHTIRFKTSLTNNLLIGDGIVVSSPFGSTGYFKSITGRTFKQGLGVAFNNITEKTSSVVLKDKDSLIFKLIRGFATLSFDNNPDVFDIDEGSELIFSLSDQVAKIYEDTSLRCPHCKIIR